MRVNLISDLHLEFADLELPGGDVLILSGDACEVKNVKKANYNPEMVMLEHERKDRRPDRFYRFFEEECRKYNDVIYVFGNHEHYDGDFVTSFKQVKENLSYLKNLHVLDKEIVEIDGITFIGGTLWTDMNKEDPLTLFHIRRMMNDFRIVKNSNRKLTRKVPLYKMNPDYTEDGKNGRKYLLDEKGNMIEDGFMHKEEDSTFCPEDAVEEHKRFKGYIQQIIEGKSDEKFVVCGHHAPSRNSTHPRYKHDELMNGGYSSSLDEYLIDHPQIKLWTHGHTHEPFNYKVGETRIICNPRGYIGYEARASEFKLLTVEI